MANRHDAMKASERGERKSVIQLEKERRSDESEREGECDILPCSVSSVTVVKCQTCLPHETCVKKVKRKTLLSQSLCFTPPNTHSGVNDHSKMSSFFQIPHKSSSTSGDKVSAEAVSGPIRLLMPPFSSPASFPVCFC